MISRNLLRVSAHVTGTLCCSSSRNSGILGWFRLHLVPEASARLPFHFTFFVTGASEVRIHQLKIYRQLRRWSASVIRSSLLIKIELLCTEQALPSLRDMASATKPFVRFSWNSVQKLVEGVPISWQLISTCNVHICRLMWVKFLYRRYPRKAGGRLWMYTNIQRCISIKQNKTLLCLLFIRSTCFDSYRIIFGPC